MGSGAKTRDARQRVTGYPKERKKRKVRHHRDSIIQSKDGRCYLCEMLDGDDRQRPDIECHHIFFGTANRRKSEEDGLKVYLCPEHHRTGPEAVHNNARVDAYLKRIAQAEYEKSHTHEEFMERYHRNYL